MIARGPLRLAKPAGPGAARRGRCRRQERLAVRGGRDLRDVVSAYLVTGWMISNQAQLPTRAQVDGVRRQIAMAMQERPPAAAAGNRQMAAELMMYELVSLIYARQEGLQTGNRPALQAIATRTAGSLRERGFDPLRIGLTDQGFVPR